MTRYQQAMERAGRLQRQAAQAHQDSMALIAAGASRFDVAVAREHEAYLYRSARAWAATALLASRSPSANREECA